MGALHSRLDYPYGVFGRKNDPSADIAPDSTSSQASGSGKGRPTPTRKEAEARNRRPLVVNDRKEARARQRRANAEARTKMDEAMRTGDDRHMPNQHRGPQKRFARDYMDARWSVGEFFLPIALVFVVLMFVVSNQPQLAFPLLMILYGLIFLGLIDAIIAGRRIRRRLLERYSESEVKGIRRYAAICAFQLRATRMPKPQVKRGQYPTL